MDFLKDFGLNPVLLAAQVVNFLILLFILKKLLYGPILDILDKRKKVVEQSLKNAEEIERRVLQTEGDREKILAKASEQAQQLLDETKKEIALMKEEGRQGAQQQAEIIIKKTQEALGMEKDKMMREVRIAAADLVAVVIQKLTGKVITKDDQKRMIEKEVRNLS